MGEDRHGRRRETRCWGGSGVAQMVAQRHGLVGASTAARNPARSAGRPELRMAGGKDEVIGRTYLVNCALAVSREEVERVGVRAAGVSRMKHHGNSSFAQALFKVLPSLKKGFNLFTVSNKAIWRLLQTWNM